MLKKVFITSILFFIIALGFAGYIVFFKNDTAPTPSAEEENSNEEFTPFGPDSENRPIEIGTSTKPTDNNETVSIPVATVTQLSADPSASTFAYTSGPTTFVRFAERAQGHIFEVNMSTGEQTRISNTTLPKIQETLWLNGGNTVIYRYLSETDSIRTYNAALVKSKAVDTTLREVKGTFLSEGIEAVVASPDLKKIFFLERISGGIQGIVAASDGSNRRTIFNSALTEWNISWPETNTITLTTKPSSGISGYAYFLNPTSGSLKKVLGPVNALATLTNPSATFVAFTDASTLLQLYNVKTGAITQAKVGTIVDKCVWSKKQSSTLYCAVPKIIGTGKFPDLWYQGQVSFTDKLYTIRIDTGVNEPLTDEKNITTKNLDISHITLSPTEEYLFVTNKKDSTPWSIRLTP
ncbi:hypothetical protein KW782_01890 [Candidatus Parcubacteria bacterium]|nr:hypothetical protein [Candidatus Parcubacteria bacterium]